MKAGTIKGWAFVHKWTSLVCTAFLLMLCLTGLPLIFHEEIDAATNPPVPLAAMPAGTPMLSLDGLLARALARYPGETPLYLSFDEERPIVYVTSAPKPDADAAQMHFQSLDGRTGAILPADPGEGGVMHVLLQLHTDMFLGTPGLLFLGAMGFLFFIAIVSGVVLYAPFMARLPFGTIRHSKRARVRWTDYHNLLGVTTLLWASVVGLTGVVNTLSGPVTYFWKADKFPAHPGEAVAPTHMSIERAVRTALKAAPDTRPQFVAFPGVAYSTDRHVAVFLQGATPLTKKLLVPALFDARSGRLDSLEPMPWYMQALLLSQPLHFGDYGGLAMKLIWAVLDVATIVVLGSGLYLWLGRRRGRGA